MIIIGIKCCIACNKRCVGCHSICEIYIEECDRNKKEKEEIRKAKGVSSFHTYGIPGVGDTKYRKRRKLQYYARGGRS